MRAGETAWGQAVDSRVMTGQAGHSGPNANHGGREQAPGCASLRSARSRDGSRAGACRSLSGGDAAPVLQAKPAAALLEGSRQPPQYPGDTSSSCVHGRPPRSDSAPVGDGGHGVQRSRVRGPWLGTEPTLPPGKQGRGRPSGHQGPVLARLWPHQGTGVGRALHNLQLPPPAWLCCQFKPR